MADEIDIIVPVYNEEECLEYFLQRIQNIRIEFNLIFIDNASTDKTVEILEKVKNATIIRHDRNEGYGASICDGISSSRAEHIVIIDADGEYPPESIPELVKRLERSDVVYASRFLGRKKVHMPRLKLIGNKMVTAIFNKLFNQDITDLYTGCKALNRSALEGITLTRKGFEHVVELGAQLSKKGIIIDEIHIDFTARKAGHSKMRHLSETVKFLFLVLSYKYR